MSTAFHAGLLFMFFSCIFLELCVNTPAIRMNWSVRWRYILYYFFFFQDLQMDYEQESPTGSIMGGNK